MKKNFLILKNCRQCGNKNSLRSDSGWHLVSVSGFPCAEASPAKNSIDKYFSPQKMSISADFLVIRFAAEEVIRMFYLKGQEGQTRLQRQRKPVWGLQRNRCDQVDLERKLPFHWNVFDRFDEKLTEFHIFSLRDAASFQILSAFPRDVTSCSSATFHQLHLSDWKLINSLVSD